MRKGVVACSGMVIGLVLLVTAFVGPWYTMNGSGALGMNYDVRLYLTRMETHGEFMGQEISTSLSYSQARENAEQAGVNTESFTVVDTAFYLALFAMFTAIITVIGMLAFVVKKGKQKMMKLLGGVFGLLTCILSLVPALYFMFTGFAQSGSGFWFTQKAMGMTLSGGPGFAWYLMIVVAIIAVISSVAILLKKIDQQELLPQVK
jgi:hypothetical protein